MEYQVARRSDGAIAIVTRVDNGFAYGDLLMPSGERMTDLPMSIASLVGQGQWEALPDLERVGPLSPSVYEQ